MKKQDGSCHRSPGQQAHGDLDEGDVALGVIRTLDRWYVDIQDMAKSMGILGLGRELVVEVEDDAGLRRVEFPDLAEEGWPEFTLAIPRDAEFGHATSSVFYRGAHYLSALRPEELLVAFKGALAESGARFEARDDHLDDYLRTTDFGGDVRIRLSPEETGRTRISIGQYRSAQRVEKTLRAIVEKLTFAGHR